MVLCNRNFLLCAASDEHPNQTNNDDPLAKRLRFPKQAKYLHEIDTAVRRNAAQL